MLSEDNIVVRNAVELVRMDKINKYIDSWKDCISSDASMKENMDLLVKAVKGDSQAVAILMSDNRPLPFAPNITYAQMSAMIISSSRSAMGRLSASVEIAISGIIILVTLIIGVLIMTQVKGTAMDVAQTNNDTEAINLITNVFNTGKAGLIILALSVLVLGAVVIIGYLRSLGGGR
jgi:hypothetical protein